jgi:predicted metal-dependent peptidase
MAVNIEAIRFKALKVAPYFGTVIWSLKVVPMPGKGTFGVTEDGRLLYDPDLDWTFEELVGAFLHEIHHRVLNHAGRAKGRDRKMWNIATDLEINNSLRRGGILLPKRALQPEQYGLPENLSAELYYAAIQQMPIDQQPQVPNMLVPGMGRCGSCAGAPEDYEADAEAQPGGASGNINSPSANDKQEQSQVEVEGMRKRVAEEVMKQQGSAPAALVEWAKTLVAPQITWQNILRTTVKRAVQKVSGGASDYSYGKVNDRTLDPSLILPTLITKRPEIAVIIDTSGSISVPELEAAVSEVAGVMRAHCNRMTVMACDETVHEVHTVNMSTSLSELRLTGGGGTDMRAGIDYALTKLRHKPNIIIVFTDAETPWGNGKPDAEVIVCLTLYAKKSYEQRIPKWAKVIRTHDKRG